VLETEQCAGEHADVWAQVAGSSDNGSCKTVHNTGFTTGTPIKAYEMSCVCGTYEGERNSYMVSAGKLKKEDFFEDLGLDGKMI
jgi:hypothetical protein